MDASIISRVSELIMEKRTGTVVPDRPQTRKSGNDSIHISSVGSEANRVSKALQEVDDQRAVRLQAIKKQVDERSFALSDAMADDIAEKIANLFI